MVNVYSFSVGSVVAFCAIVYVFVIMFVWATNMMAWMRENMPTLPEKEKESEKENEKQEESKEERPKKKTRSSHKRSPKKRKRRGRHTPEVV